MLDLIAKHKRFIKSFHISLYEQEGEMLRFTGLGDTLLNS